jgi:hypothetical protein
MLPHAAAAQALVSLLRAISVFNFNLELLSLECSVSVNFTTRWYAVQALPLVLLAAILVVCCTIKAMQWVQRVVLRVLPFGAIGGLSLLDIAVGLQLAGSYTLYFGACVGARPAVLHTRTRKRPLHPPNCK